MSLIESVFFLALLVAALWYGVKLSAKQKEKIRQSVLENQDKNRVAIDLVKQGKLFHAENYLINCGMRRSAARMTSATIKEMLRKGEL